MRITAALVQELVELTLKELPEFLARRNILWRLRPGTVVESTGTRTTAVSVLYDNAGSPSRMMSLVGPLRADDRVMCVSVPPAGNYIIGRLNGYDVQTYTPTLAALTTSPNLGSGATYVQTGWWVRENGWVSGQARLRFGSTGTSAGTGAYRITLPTNLDGTVYAGSGVPGLGNIIGNGMMRDDSTAAARQFAAQVTTVNGFALMCESGPATNAVPWGWGPGDAISVGFRYFAEP